MTRRAGPRVVIGGVSGLPVADVPPDRAGGFDGKQDFITGYGDPFDG